MNSCKEEKKLYSTFFKDIIRAFLNNIYFLNTFLDTNSRSNIHLIFSPNKNFKTIIIKMGCLKIG